MLHINPILTSYQSESPYSVRPVLAVCPTGRTFSSDPHTTAFMLADFPTWDTLSPNSHMPDSLTSFFKMVSHHFASPYQAFLFYFYSTYYYSHTIMYLFACCFYGVVPQLVFKVNKNRSYVLFAAIFLAPKQ